MNPSLDKEQLLSMSQQQLDEVFTSSPPGPIPNGEARGTAIIAPGTTYSADIAQAINVFAWQGKVFDAAHGTLVNRILPFGINAIVAQVYVAPSWFDKKDCIVLDYSKTLTLAHWIPFWFDTLSRFMNVRQWTAPSKKLEGKGRRSASSHSQLAITPTL